MKNIFAGILLVNLILGCAFAEGERPRTDGGEGENGSEGMGGGPVSIEDWQGPHSCSKRPCPAALLEDVGYTTATGPNNGAEGPTTFSTGENIYGPYEAGLGTAQINILRALGCTNDNEGHVDGGINTKTSEAVVARGCNVKLPRVEIRNDEEVYVGLLDRCGGHTPEYHFHERLSCLYSRTPGSKHSAQVGAEDTVQVPSGSQYYLYGKYENYDTKELPQLDACGGHFGVTPDSNCQVVYHYHVQDNAPFTFGCFGPDYSGEDEEILVTLEKCRELYAAHCDNPDNRVTLDLQMCEVDDDGNPGTSCSNSTISYQKWCPCYDADGSNTGTATLPVFASGNTVKKSEAKNSCSIDDDESRDSN